jgi:hypothetical protein
LQPTVFAKGRQVALVETPEQVLAGMEHGRGVRFDGGAVTGLEELEVERGENGDHRCRAGLMTTDLGGLVRVFTHIVGVVNHQRRKPEHAAFDFLENGDVFGAEPDALVFLPRWRLP